jgi:hypothetical protein
MGPLPRYQHRGFRRALVASASIHLSIIAVVAVCLMLPHSQTPQGPPGIDTRISELTIRLDPEETVALATPEPIKSNPPSVPPQLVSSVMGHPPTTSPIPSAIPPQLLAIIRRTQKDNTPGENVSHPADSNVKPASGTITAPGVSPLHGAMRPGQSVVYILDCSGSMGEFGKFELARAALIATLYRQPEGVRCQVIPYNSTARLLIPGGLISVATNSHAVESKLAMLEAAGRSNHTEALRLAIGLRPDAIVWLTDADDLSIAKLKSVLKSAEKPVAVYVAEVSSRGVGPPRELR